MNARTAAAGAALVAVALGVAIIASPGLAAFLPGLGGVVTLLGLVAVGAALRVAQLSWREGDPARLPAVETPESAPTPGDERLSTLAAFGGTAHSTSPTRGHLTEAAVAVLVRYRGLGEEEARDAVATGEWTEDRVAASFLAAERPERGRVRRTRERLRRVVAGESAYERGVRRTADAVAAVAGLEPTSEALDWRQRLRDVVAPGRERTDGAFEAGEGARPTHRWRAVAAVAFGALGVGLLARRPAVALAAVVGVGFAAYARAGSPPAPSLTVERTVSTERATPGERVGVTVEVRNDGDRTLSDLRLVDGVPPGLGVEEGTPRCATALRPGETETLEYALTARRGRHTFGPACSVARDLPGSWERSDTHPVAGDERVVCAPDLRALETRVPLLTGGRYPGAGPPSPGEGGVEFHAVRAYRRGDPASRVDWNRFARTGELTTLEFTEERVATVVLVVDARPEAYVTRSPGASHAVDRSVAAAGRLFETLRADGARVGVGALGDEDCWLPPGTDRHHRERARELLTGHPSREPPAQSRRPGPVDAAGVTASLRERLPDGAQVALLTPLVDDAVVRVVRDLGARGYPTAVVSPDPTADRTAGHRMAGVARSLRMSDLRSAGVPTVDWGGEDLETALARFSARWSR